MGDSRSSKCSINYCFTRITRTVFGSISYFLPGGAWGMFFTYPAATTSPKVLGRRWCSKLYLRSAWVNSPSVASETAFSEPSATRGGSVAGTPAADWPGAAPEAGAEGEVSGRLPQPARRTTITDARIRRGVMPNNKSELLEKTSHNVRQRAGLLRALTSIG